MKHLNVSAASLMDHTPAEICLRVDGRNEEMRRTAYLTALLGRVEKFPRIEQLEGRKRSVKEARKDFEELREKRNGRKPR